MMLVQWKYHGPGANCIENAPGPVKCNKCGKYNKYNKYNKYSKCSKCSKCAYLAVPHSSSPGGEQAGGKASTIDPGRGCTLVRTTPACAGSYHELRRRRRLPAGTRPDSAGCAGSYHEIVMAFRLPSAARPVSTPTTDKTTVPSAAGTTSSNTARYLSRPVPVHSFMP